MTKFDELKERYPNLIPVQELRSNVSIVELAIQYGYEPQLHKGKSRPVLEHPGYKDTIIIKNPLDPAHQVYQRAGDFTDAGTIIDFIRNRMGTVFSQFNRPGENEFKNITRVLYDYLKVDPDHVKQNRQITTKLAEPVVKQPFTKEQFDIRPLEPDNYLNQRHIAPATLQRPEFAGKVVSQVTYFDPARGHADNFAEAKQHPERNYLQFTNVAFPYFNGQSTEVTGLELRNEKIKLHAPGSDRTNSIFVSNPPPRTTHFHVMESAIDALSHRQLRSLRGDDNFDSVYFSTGGQLTAQQINTIVRYVGSFDKSDNWSIRMGFDNDPKGFRYDLQFIQQLSAVKFPMSPTVASTGRIAYLLPEQESYRSIRDLLLDRIELYNKDVQAQFVRAEGDTLGQKELGTQLITVSRAGQQVQIGIPEASAPLSIVSNLLLEATGMEQRIKLDKSCFKDFNMELAREISMGEKFRYGIKDETGTVLINGNSPTQMARSIQQLKNQTEGEGVTKSLFLYERQPFGFTKNQVELKIEQGVTKKAVHTPDFNAQIQLEKSERSQAQLLGEARKPMQAVNPEDRPKIGQLPQPGQKPRQNRPKHE
jgi:hypothetical protein